MFWEINSKFEHEKEYILEIPNLFSSASNVIHQKRNIIKKLEHNSYTYVVKSFGLPNLINKFIYGFIRKGKAKRSYENALLLLDAGIKTAVPVAFGEQKKFGLMGSSYYVSLNVAFDFDFHDINFERVECNELLFKQFAEFTYRLHQAGFLHLDYTPGNILIKKENGVYDFTIIDINRMYIGNIPWQKGAESLGKFFFREPWNSIFIKTYAEKSGREVSEIEEIVKRSRLQFQRKGRLKNFLRGKK